MHTLNVSLAHKRTKKVTINFLSIPYPPSPTTDYMNVSTEVYVYKGFINSF